MTRNWTACMKLIKNPTLGYRFRGYYGEANDDTGKLKDDNKTIKSSSHLGTLRSW